MRRLYTVEELDAQVYPDLCGLVEVDSPVGVVCGALSAVYQDGRFEVVTEEDVTHQLKLEECKVFLKD